MPDRTQDGEDLRAYLQRAIASFDGDPADTDFQRGYLAALKEVSEAFFGKERPDPDPKAVN